jgi:hypothetical protein
MPLDQVQSYDYFYDRVVGTEYKFAWFPKTCHISGKRIWFEWSYRLTFMWNDPFEPAFEYRWHDKNAHIIWKLTK